MTLTPPPRLGLVRGPWSLLPRNINGKLYCSEVVVVLLLYCQDGYMRREQLEMLEEKKLELLAVIRCDAITLTDAFDFHDNFLQSVLGRYDGNVYENLYKWAKSSPLNETEV